MDMISLNGKWNLTGTSPSGDKIELDGYVPGCTLNDIANSKKGKELGDIFFRDNAEKYQKFENYNWIYSKNFNTDINFKKAKIIFKKLDTYCDIYINDNYIASCDNGYISHSFELENIIKKGENKIVIYFTSPVLAVSGKRARNAAFSTGRVYTRRPQFSYGWDWAMRFVPCGMGDVYIEPNYDDMKIKSVYVYTKYIDDEFAKIGVDVWFDNCKLGETVKLEAYDPFDKLVKVYSRYFEEEHMRVELDIANALLWNPNGYGDQNLYTIKVKCGASEKKIQFGIRSAVVMQLTDDKEGENYKKCIELKQSDIMKELDKNTEFSGFVVKVNGKRIMCKGANWVPCTPFYMNGYEEKITRILELSKAAGINFIRVWGGGDFECEHFYDECSRLGILVCQDFLMACGNYPDDETWFLMHIKAEAEYATELIRNKACFLWWCGDNENATNVTTTDRKYQGRAAAFKASAPTVWKKDPFHIFFQTSPVGGKAYACNTVGLTHNTAFLSDFFRYIEKSDMSDFLTKYKDYLARFIAEEPVFGAATTQTLKKIMTDDEIYGNDMSMWIYHTKTNDSLNKHLFVYLLQMAEKYLGKFNDGKDRVFKLKYIQFEWLRISMEMVRREKGFCHGVIYWMLNDNWPAASGWSLIDFYNNPKAAYYSFKRCAKPIIASIDLTGDGLAAYICSDSSEHTINVKCMSISDDGKTVKTLYQGVHKTEEKVAVKVWETEKNDGSIIVVELSDENGIIDRAFYKDGTLGIAPCKVKVLRITENYVEVEADKYVHAVELDGETVFEDNYFSLLPGEKRCIIFEKAENKNIDVSAYTLK